MSQFDVFHVVGDGVQAFSLVEHFVGRDENELRVPVDEFFDEPRAGDSVDLDVLAGDPFHAILHSRSIRTRSPRRLSIWADAKPPIAVHARSARAAATRHETFARSQAP